MATTNLLTSADLAELRQTALGAANPLGVAAELVDAVDQGRLADPADTGYALTLAAEIAESKTRLESALRWAERAVEAYRTQGDSEAGFARALRARILFRSGRDDEAITELAALRPLLGQEPDAAAYISAALDAGGRNGIAEQWLSTAVKTLLQQRAERPDPAAEAEDRTTPGVLFFLLQQRHRVRRVLNLTHDQHDDLADRLENELNRGGAEATRAAAAAPAVAALFWPREEFERLLSRWPALTESYGQDWDEHRARLERELVRLANGGRTGLTLVPGSTDGLAGYATRAGGEPTDSRTRNDYAQELADRGNGHIPWPPARNESCWCGSGNKYKKCCLPRSRA